MTWHLWVLLIAVGGTALLVVWATIFDRDTDDENEKRTEEYYDRDRNR